MVAIIGVAAAASAELGAIYQRRQAEKELLFVGAEFQRALQSFAAATPTGQPTQPRTLEDLLRDPRYPNVVRHLRKVYADPMTGKADWVIVKSPDGQTIVGLHSASTGRPIQITHFPSVFQGFDRRKSYTDWVFFARVPALTQGQRPPDGTVNSGDLSGSASGGGNFSSDGMQSNGSPLGSSFGSSSGSPPGSPFGSSSGSQPGSPFGSSSGSSFGSSFGGNSPGGSSPNGSLFNNSPFGGSSSGNGMSNR
ncbi:hypothetical protein [Paraburkholderia rhizosphaerae]|uniref:Type II secretory pathway pseudopilin PulG n=1 Tax=Paraburkholderia rhizosphaerae TaxID=480658 RepID=A0A4R8KNT1_9BURK|nr:hypothetical protein [Paraburkholderia rhizosphaerae]TDY31266.1 hypothetical protein BX592_1523 [Paraburkholderia rhizosphaerae]